MWGRGHCKRTLLSPPGCGIIIARGNVPQAHRAYINGVHTMNTDSYFAMFHPVATATSDAVSNGFFVMGATYVLAALVGILIVILKPR